VGGLGLGTPGDGGAQRAVGASAAAAARDAAAGASSSALRRREGASGLEARVPKEVQRLVHFLEAPHALRTPGLFANSCQQCLDAYQGAGSSGTGQRAQQQVAQGSGSSSSSSSDSCSDSSSSARLQALLAATAPVRWALDTGLDLPRHVAPHQAAAALLLLLQQLPEPLMPPDVSAVLAHVVPPPPAAASLLSDTLSVAEWATLRMVLALARGALQREHALCNGLSVASLAGVLAEHCFGAESLGEFLGQRAAGVCGASVRGSWRLPAAGACCACAHRTSTTPTPLLLCRVCAQTVCAQLHRRAWLPTASLS
jgi:hypothetical protein